MEYTERITQYKIDCFAYKVSPNGAKKCNALKELNCKKCKFYKDINTLTQELIECEKRNLKKGYANKYKELNQLNGRGKRGSKASV